MERSGGTKKQRPVAKEVQELIAARAGTLAAAVRDLFPITTANSRTARDEKRRDNSRNRRDCYKSQMEAATEASAKLRDPKPYRNPVNSCDVSHLSTDRKISSKQG